MGLVMAMMLMLMRWMVMVMVILVIVAVNIATTTMKRHSMRLDRIGMMHRRHIRMRGPVGCWRHLIHSSLRVVIVVVRMGMSYWMAHFKSIRLVMRWSEKRRLHMHVRWMLLAQRHKTIIIIIVMPRCAMV